MAAKKHMYELYISMTLSLNRGLTSRTQQSKSVNVATRTYRNEQRSKAYMTQLYINPTLTLDQRGDQPREVKRKRIRCKRIYNRHRCVLVMNSEATAYIAQLYIRVALSRGSHSNCIMRLYKSIAVSLDQKVDQPRAAKRTRTRCKTRMQPRVPKQSIYDAAIYQHRVEPRPEE